MTTRGGYPPGILRFSVMTALLVPVAVLAMGGGRAAFHSVAAASRPATSVVGYGHRSHLQPFAHVRGRRWPPAGGGLPLGAAPTGLMSTRTAAKRAGAQTRLRHFEYVVPDGSIDVYDIDHGNKLVKSYALPDARGVRGLAVSLATRSLYVSYGGDGGEYGNGSLLRYDLVTHTIIWEKSYSHGIDSMAVSRDGKRIYMP